MSPREAVFRKGAFLHQAGIVEIPVHTPLVHLDAGQAAFRAANAFGAQGVDKPVAQVLAFIGRDHERSTVALGVGNLAEAQTLDVAELLADAPFCVAHGTGNLVELTELGQSHGARQFGHACTNAPQLKVFFGRIQPAFGIARVAKVVNGKAAFVEVLVTAHHHAAVAAGHVLVELEAEDGDVAKAAGWFAVQTGTRSLGAVFQQVDAVFFGDFSNFVDVTRCAAHVDEQHGLGALVDLGFQISRVHAERIVNIDQAGNGAKADNG